MCLPEDVVKAGNSQAANAAWHAANFRSQNQTSPLGYSEYETEVERVRAPLQSASLRTHVSLDW
jgi:hypothetical protein